MVSRIHSRDLVPDVHESGPQGTACVLRSDPAWTNGEGGRGIPSTGTGATEPGMSGDIEPRIGSTKDGDARSGIRGGIGVPLECIASVFALSVCVHRHIAESGIVVVVVGIRVLVMVGHIINEVMWRVFRGWRHI